MKSEPLSSPNKQGGFGTYLSSVDSDLLRRALREYGGGTSLEIGAGNGGNLLELGKRFRMVVGTDLIRPRSKVCDEGACANYVIADGASCLRDGVFDLVAFNPPYIPTEGIEDIAVDGGEGGIEVAVRFLKEALRVVKTSGRIVMLVSSENPVNVLEQECRKEGFFLAPLISMRLFYETLFVYVAERHQFQA